MKIRFLNSIFSKFIMKAHAISYMTTTDGVSGALDGHTAGTFSESVKTVYSKEIEFQALPIMRFLQFTDIKTELGVEPGLTINMLVYDNLTQGGTLTEGTRIETKALSGSLTPITVLEKGNGVTVSQLLIVASFDSVMGSAAILLARDYALVLDTDLRDVALTGTNVVYAKTSTGTVISSRATLDVTCTFKVSTVKDAIEVLATNNATKFNFGFWICFVHPYSGGIAA